MNCPRTDELIKFFDGELSVNQHRALTEHLKQCPQCTTQQAEIERIAQRIRPREHEFEDPSLVQDVMQRIYQIPVEETPHRRSLFSLKFIIPSIAAVAAGFVLLFFVPWHRALDREESQFLTRGGESSSENRWVSLMLFQKRSDHASYQSSYEKVRDEISTDARLVFGYQNTQSQYRYLMIFSIDNEGNIFWYYPAYETEGTNPSSIAIETGRHELQDEIEHRYQPGSLRIMGLFTKEPLQVSFVENTIKQALKRDPSVSALKTLPLPETGQASYLIRVIARVPVKTQ